MANYFQKLVLKTVQEVGANLYIMMFGFPPFKHLFGRKIIQIDTLLSQHRAVRTPLNHALGQQTEAGSSVKPRCLCIYPHR